MPHNPVGPPDKGISVELVDAEDLARSRRLDARPHSFLHEPIDPQRLLELPLEKLVEIAVGRLKSLREARRQGVHHSKIVDDIELLHVVVIRFWDLIQDSRRARRGRESIVARNER